MCGRHIFGCLYHNTHNTKFCSTGPFVHLRGQCWVLSKFKTNGCPNQIILNIQDMVHTAGKLSAQCTGTLVENAHPRGGDCKGVTWQKHIHDEVQTCRIIKDRLWERKKTLPLGWAGGLFLKIFIYFLRYFNHGYYLVKYIESPLWLRI